MITLSNITKKFDNDKIIEDLSLTFKKGKVTSILGPSGCGKTTLLRIITGLDTNFMGEIECQETKFSYVFQEDRLLEWESAENNITFALGKSYNEQHINNIMDLLHIKELRDMKVKKLSGGQRQRVSIARAFAYPADTIIMDEPFNSLDISLKSQIIQDLSSLIKQENKTIILVTHDIKEALLLSDKIHLISGNPSELKGSYSVTIPIEHRSMLNDSLRTIEKEILSVILAVN